MVRYVAPEVLNSTLYCEKIDTWCHHLWIDRVCSCMWQGDGSYRIHATLWASAISTRHESIVAQKGILESQWLWGVGQMSLAIWRWIMPSSVSHRDIGTASLTRRKILSKRHPFLIVCMQFVCMINHACWQMIVIDVQKRLSMAQVLDHPWFTNVERSR